MTSYVDTVEANAAAQLAIDPSSSALFVDIDGTLLDIAPTPAAVAVPSPLIETLRKAQAAFGGALAVITGRRIADADRLLHPLKLAAAGVHGGEIRRSPNDPILTTCASIDGAVLKRLNNISRLVPGVIVEEKGLGAAVHYRLAPDNEDEIRAMVLDAIGGGALNLALTNGRKVFEILPAGLSKGVALEALLAHPPFKGKRPIMVGDDAGDVPAFDFARRQGGLALRVAGEHFSQHVAEFGGPASVRAWLNHIAAPLHEPTR